MIKNNNEEIVKQIYNVLIDSKKVTIFAHENKDNDAYSSSLAMCYFLRSLNIDARIDNIDAIVSCSVKPFIDKSLPIADDEFINGSTGIFLDVGNSHIISTQGYLKCNQLVRIDHHIFAEKFAEYEWVDHNYSSTCEMVGWFILECNHKMMTKQIAETLYVGILTDTGEFMYDTTQASTFDLIRIFYDCGFEKNKMQDKLFLNDWDEVLNSRNLSNEVKVVDGGIAYLILDDKIKEKYNVNDDEGKIFIMNDIRDFNVWFSVYFKPNKNCYKVSIRSRQFPVREIACKYNGGGHRLAAGFSLKSLNEIDNLINDIRKLMKMDKN